MPKYFIYLTIFFSLEGHSQTINKSCNFLIEGKVLGRDSGRLCLRYIDSDNKNIHDTIFYSSGKFEISGYINEPTIASIEGDIKSKSADDSCFVEFYLEPKKLKIELLENNFKKIQVFGSTSQNDLQKLEFLKSSIYSEQKVVEQAFSKVNSLLLKDRDNEILNMKRDSLIKCLEPFSASLRKIELQFISDNPTSYINPMLLWYQLRYLSIDSVQIFYSILDKPVQNSSWGRKISRLLNNQIGVLANNFSAIDYKGNKIELSSFRGSKLVLIDFWATWCAPCRANNPHLINLYQKYKNGLEIIGIADDDERIEAWKNAIKQDKTDQWIQTLQKKGTKEDLFEKFGVLIVPTKILINEKGIIIGRYEGVDDLLLDKKLIELFGN